MISFKDYLQLWERTTCSKGGIASSTVTSDVLIQNFLTDQQAEKRAVHDPGIHAICPY